MAETTKLNSLKINLLTNEQYTTAKEAGEIDLNQLYMITDEVDEAVSWNDLTDKPFEQSVESVLMVDNEVQDPIYGIYGALTDYATGYGALRSDTIVIGETYIVAVDGVSYEGVAEENTNDGTVMIFGPFEDFSLAPVNIYQYTEIMYANFEDNEAHHLTIHHVQNKYIKTIDETYIPDTIARTEDVTTVTIKTWTAADMT